MALSERGRFSLIRQVWGRSFSRHVNPACVYVLQALIKHTWNPAGGLSKQLFKIVQPTRSGQSPQHRAQHFDTRTFPVILQLNHTSQLVFLHSESLFHKTIQVCTHGIHSRGEHVRIHGFQVCWWQKGRTSLLRHILSFPKTENAQ